jgi:hypothetical protein
MQFSGHHDDRHSSDLDARTIEISLNQTNTDNFEPEIQTLEVNGNGE